MASSKLLDLSREGQLDFVTMGMFIIDEIHFPPPRKPEIDILGGAGSWSVLGARLFREPPASRRISWIVHKGSDFPHALDEQISSWCTTCNLIDTPERLTTRGWNSYGEEEARAFKYMTPKLRIDETQLTDEQLLAKCFHLICTPSRCINLVEGILSRRDALLDGSRNAVSPSHASLSRPIFVWEPVPDACKPEEFTNAMRALPYVDFVSPNHQELAAFFDEPSIFSGSKDDIARIQSQMDRFMHGWSSGGGSGGRTMVVRCGETGCVWSTDIGSHVSVRPYHRSDGSARGLGEPSRVVDPTGAGNAFLGGFCAGLVEDSNDSSNRIRDAIRYGLVAASFAIEQVGLPRMTTRHGQEMWNGDIVQRRIEALKKSDG